MCDPVTAGVMAAGLGASFLGNNMQQKTAAENAARQEASVLNARADTMGGQREARTAENARQQKLADESFQIFGKTSADTSSSLLPQSLDAAAARREAEDVKSIESAPMAVGAFEVPSNAPRIVKQDAARRGMESLVFGKQQARARARLGSFQDGMFGVNTATREGRLAQGDVGRRAGSSASLLPLDYAGAERTPQLPAPRSSPFGALLSGVGQAATSYGANMAFAPGATTAPTPPIPGFKPTPPTLVPSPNWASAYPGVF